MADTVSNANMVRIPGGRWVNSISPVEIQQAFGSLPNATVLASASVLIDELSDMENSFVFALRGRQFSRAVTSIVSYYNLKGDDLQSLIRILAHYDYARPFLNLAVPSNDDGLKKYLLDNGVLWDQILFHYEFSAWDPVRFTAGFVAGLGYSAASILEVLKDLFDFGVEAFSKPETAARKIKEFIEGLRQLSLDSFVAMAKETWANWQKEFSEALLDLDFDKAGLMLGKLAGDLWQLLTGIRALAKLPGMTMKLARKFGSLFARGARYSRRAVELMIELLQKLSAAIKEAITIGFGAVQNFFQDTKLLLQKLGEGALMIIDETGAILFNIPEKGLVMEGIGMLDEGYLLAQASENTTTVLARVRVGFQKGLDHVSGLKSATSQKVKRFRNAVLFVNDIKEIEKRATELIKAWRDTLQSILTENKIPINPLEIGKWIHENLEHAFDDLISALSKVYAARTEIKIRSLAGILAKDKAELKLFLERADTPLLGFAKKWPGMLEALGVSDEEELAKLLKKMGYADPSKTLIGDLISDGVLFNDDTKRLLSIDWTSGLGKYRFANELEAVIKAGQSLTDAEKLELAKKFLKHTFREYALREAILEHIFEGWDTKVIEIMYDPFRIPKT